jgi:hypothetical protein
VPVSLLVGVALVVNGSLVMVGFGREVVVESGYVETRDDVRGTNRAVAGELAWAIAHTFVAPRPASEATWASPEQNPEYAFILSYAPLYRHGLAGAWRAAVTLGLLGLGLAGLLRNRQLARLSAVPLAILLANVGIHLFYGDHFALYALHWEPALLFMLAGVAFLPGRLRRLGNLVLGSFVLLAAVNSYGLIRDLLTRLATA